MKHVKLKPSDTTVDHRYQRALDVRRVEAMARAYDPNLMGVPVISKRADGSCVRIDGQHRLATALAAGAGDVPILMEVHEDLSVQEEAELFLRLNGGRKAVGAIDKFKARLEAREPTALEIQIILKKVGCKITGSAQHKGVNAVEAVEHAYHKGNLESTMRVLVTWLDGDPKAFARELVRAVSSFLAACPDAEPLHLAARLDQYAPQKLAARLNRERQQIMASHAEVARIVLMEIYNHKTPKTRRLSWQGAQQQQPQSMAS